jgi:hypothetical protein
MTMRTKMIMKEPMMKTSMRMKKKLLRRLQLILPNSSTNSKQSMTRGRRLLKKWREMLSKIQLRAQ